MLRPRHLFAATLFLLFIYLFGYHSICKYLTKNTIVIETVEKITDIPAPAITIVPFWKNNVDPYDDTNNTCWFEEDVYDCLQEKYTYPIDKIIHNSTHFNWTSRFEPLHSILYTLNSHSMKLSSKIEKALVIMIINDTWPPFGGTPYPDPDFLPSYCLHDPKYFTFSANPKYVC